MLFSELIDKLKKGQSGLIDFKLSNDPKILSASALEKARSNDISFLDKNSPKNLRNFIEKKSPNE